MDKTKYIEKQRLLLEKLEEAQAVLIGIGEEFNEDFADIAKFPRLMDALEEVGANTSLEWAVPFIEKLYIEGCHDGKQAEAYQRLYGLVKDKDYFIITTCIDGSIEKAGFHQNRIVEPCGSYKLLQCSGKCCSDLCASDKFTELVRQALASSAGLDSLHEPVCPSCGRPLVFNNILCEGSYVEEGYQHQWEKYTKWLQLTLNKKLCVLELGVGMSLPKIIRWPFEKVAFYNKKSSFFRVNGTLYQMTEELGDKGISIDRNAVDFLLGCDLQM